MSIEQLNIEAYKNFLHQAKSIIHSTQAKAALTINASLIFANWELGRLITEKQKEFGWGNRVIDQLAKDLKTEMPDVVGFSRANLFYIRKFYLFYSDQKVQQLVGLSPGQNQVGPIIQQLVRLLPSKSPETTLVQQAVAQIPWGHHILILSKVKDPEQALFYIQQTIEYNWSRSILALQIEQNLFARQGKAITNFKTTLSEKQAMMAQQILKDPYNFGFLTLEPQMQELEIEKQLTAHITKFLLELGKGFAFIGRQYSIEVGEKDYRLDLLFYHIRLRCFVVIDLKTGEFEPEFAGKMNFYLSAVDDQLKQISDQPSIGIILCKSKNGIEVEYTLRDIKKPIGVSEFMVTQALPAELKSSIPSIEEFENELNKNFE
jgi:predicted nuclease of restriction endonuclease-like (RecB) superfamily